MTESGAGAGLGEPGRRELAEEYPQWRVFRRGPEGLAWWRPDPEAALMLRADSWDGLRKQIIDHYLAALRAEFPAWEFWRHVAGAGWYARRPRSSPPVAVGPVPLPELADAVRARIRQGAR